MSVAEARFAEYLSTSGTARRAAVAGQPSEQLREAPSTAPEMLPMVTVIGIAA